jgi:methionine-rich copper-binding protein CopC
MRSEPASGEVLSTAPTQVTLWFSQELTSGGQLRVFDGGAQRMDDGNTRVSVTEPKSMTVDLRPLSPGSYQVEWEAISLEDGDKSGGSFAFSVGEPGTTSGGAGTSRSGRGSTLLAGALAIAILALAVALVALVRRRPAA